MVKDRVCIGSSENNLCLDDFLFLSAFEMSENPFKEVEFDGIIGLGFPQLSMSPDANFLDSLVKSNKISQKLFAFYFRKNMDLVENPNLGELNSEEYIEKNDFKSKFSELMIGGIDFTKIGSKINFVNVISKKYWEVKLDNIYYGSYKLPFCQENYCTAIIDTGTSTIGGPKILYNSFERLAKIDQDCKNLNKLKNISFEINGNLYELEPKDYSIKIKATEDNKFSFSVPDDNADEQ